MVKTNRLKIDVGLVFKFLVHIFTNDSENIERRKNRK